MTLGRPKSSDSPEKYRDAYALYHLTQPNLPPSSNATEEIGAFLEWAIGTEREGFAEGDIISIGSLATGVGKSRNTVAKGVDLLIAKGMVVRGKLKSPYRIVATAPVFKDARLVADENISLTIKMESRSRFGEVRSCDLQDHTSDISVFLERELAESRDPLVQEASQVNWRAGEVQLFQRLRTVLRDDQEIGVLAELTFLRLAPETAHDFRATVSQLLTQDVGQISLYPILEQCGIRDLRAGRTQISVGSPPEFLGNELRTYLDARQVVLDAYDSHHPMMKWTYALFQPDTAPMVSFSVCYVRSDLLSVFMRKMDIEMDPT